MMFTFYEKLIGSEITLKRIPQKKTGQKKFINNLKRIAKRIKFIYSFLFSIIRNVPGTYSLSCYINIPRRYLQ